MEFPRDVRAFLQGKGNILKVYKSGPATQAIIAQELLRSGRSVVVITPDGAELGRMRALLDLFSSWRTTGTPADIPLWEQSWVTAPPFPASLPKTGEWSARWAFLHALRSRNGALGAVVSVENLLPRWPDPAVVDTSSLELLKGEEILLESLLEQAVAWGYTRTGMVASPGEIAVRGDIFDIFPSGYRYPVRLELFGDTLEEIRFFDPASQRSKGDLDRITILPAAPSVFSDDTIAEAGRKWAHLKTTGQLPGQSRQKLEQQVQEHDGSIFPGLFYGQPVSLADYFPKDAVFLLTGASDLRVKLEEAQWAWSDLLQRIADEDGTPLPEKEIIHLEAEARKTWLDKRQIVFEALLTGQTKQGVDMPESEISDFSDLFWKPEQRRRPWSAVCEALRDWEKSARQTILSFRSQRSRAKFLDLAQSEDIFPHTEYSPEGRGIYALISP